MKKIYLLIFLAFLFLFSSTAYAEDFDIIADWMDAFYKDTRDPWILQKSDISFLKSTFPDFVCQNSISENNDRLFVCISRKGAYKGSYQMTLNFGNEGVLLLQAVEIAVMHPDLSSKYIDWQGWKFASERLSDSIAKKSYISPIFRPIESTLSKDTFHLLMFKDAEYGKMFKFRNSVVTTGYADKVLILNFSSEKYYRDHTYIIHCNDRNKEECREYLLLG